MACVGGSIGEEDSVSGIDKGVGAVQGDLVAGVVLTVSVFVAEPPVLEGVSVRVVRPSTRDKLVEGVRTWMGVHQWSQWCVGFFGDGYMEGGGKLAYKRGLKDTWLIVKGEF